MQQNSVVLAMDFLNNRQKLIPLETADTNTLLVLDQEFTGPPDSKEWAWNSSCCFSYHEVDMYTRAFCSVGVFLIDLVLVWVC